MKPALLAITFFLCVVLLVTAAQELNTFELKHKLMKREASCVDTCLKMKRSKNVNTCKAACGEIISETTEQVITEMVQPALQESATTLSELSAEEQQNEATASLWELFYDKLRRMLTAGGFSPGFQLLHEAIDLTDIRAQIGGWESMDLFALQRAYADDFDNSAILALEMMKATEPGRFRDTSSGMNILDEYKRYLGGVQGIQQISIPDPNYTESARRTREFEEALMTCTDKYFSANFIVLSRYDMDSFTVTFCPEVKQTESLMFAQIGVEQANVAGNPAYGAAVALGLTQLYTAANAFKKYHTIRSMELECVRAQQENRPARGTARSFSFSYDYTKYKYSGESKSKSMSIGLGFLSVGKASQKMKMTGFDATGIGGVDIAFQDYKFIPLYTGSWFSSTALKDFRYVRREGHASPISRFFSDKGSLTLIPRGLYIAVNPSISFHISNDKKESLKTAAAKSMSIGLNVFGFSFGLGMGKASSLDEGAGTGGNSKITISSQSCRPQLFAVDHLYNY